MVRQPLRSTRTAPLFPYSILFRARAVHDLGTGSGLGKTVRSLVERGRSLAGSCAERLGLREGDPLVPSHMGKRTPEQIAAVHAVASAERKSTRLNSSH